MQRQITKKIIEDEYINLSFLNTLNQLNCTEDGSVIKYTSLKETNLDENQICKRINKFGWFLKIQYEKRRNNGELLDKERNRKEERKVKLFWLGKKEAVSVLDIEGLHVAISTMQEDETAWFKIQPKMHFFPEGSNKEEFITKEKLVIKSNEDLVIKIHINSIEKIWD